MDLESIPDPRQEVADEDNAALALAEAMAAAPPKPEELEDYPSRANPEAMDYGRACEDALQAADEALQRPGFRFPDWPDLRPQVTSAARDYARLKSQQAFLRAMEGDLLGALASVRGATDLADRATDGTASLIHYLVSVALTAIACRGYWCLLGPPPEGLDPALARPTQSWPATGWSSEVTAAWRAEARRLAGYDREPAAARRTLAAEFHWMAERLMDRASITDRETRWWSRLASPQATIAWGVPRIQSFLDRLQVQPWQRCPLVPRPPSLSCHDWFSNPVGKKLLADSMWSVAACEEHSSRRLARVRLVAVAIALKLYLERHQRLPNALPELVSDGLLPELPPDPYSGRAPCYRPYRGILYSVGPNQRDDDGLRLMIGKPGLFRRRLTDLRYRDDEVIPLAFLIDPDKWSKGGAVGWAMP